MRIRNLTAALVVLMMIMGIAAPAGAYGYEQGSTSCDWNKTVQIKSRSTLNADHYWDTGLKSHWFGDWGWHYAYTKTYRNSTQWTVVTLGELNTASTYGYCITTPF